MSNESFKSLSEIQNVTPHEPKYEAENQLKDILKSKESNSNPGTFRSDSSSTITNDDTKSEMCHLPQKCTSMSEKSGSAQNIKKNGKKFYNVRSTKASRAREELNRRNERQNNATSTPFMRSLYNVPVLNIPMRKIPSATNLISTSEPTKVLANSSPNTYVPETPPQDQSKAAHVLEKLSSKTIVPNFRTDKEAINSQNMNIAFEKSEKLTLPLKHSVPSLSKTIASSRSPKSILTSPLEPIKVSTESQLNTISTIEPEVVTIKAADADAATSEIKNVPSNDVTTEPALLDVLKLQAKKSPDFRNVVKAKFKTLNTKLGTPPITVEKLHQDKGDCNELIKKYRKDLSIRQKMAPIRENILKDNRTKYERKIPEQIPKIKEREQRKPCNKEFINSPSVLYNTSKCVGTPESNIGDNILATPKAKERQELKIPDRLLIKKRCNKLSSSPKQLVSSDSEKKIIDQVQVEKNNNEIELKTVDEISGDSPLPLVEKLKEELSIASDSNKNMEKQLKAVTEELNNTSIKLKIAEAAVEHLKTQQQSQLMSLSKRVAEVDELMSSAVAERELWKARAAVLENDLKNKTQTEGKAQADKQKRESKRTISEENNGNTCEVTHREERIHTNDEKKGERKQKTVIKILKTVKKVQLTPEMYDKISFHE